MIYLLDANVLIDAHRDYYPFQRVPEFWDWLVHMGSLGKIKVPVEIMEEFKPSDPDLSDWVASQGVENYLILAEEVDVGLIRVVTERGYAPDLNDEEVETIGRDPFLIANAMVDASERVVVSTEASKPSKQRGNRRVPDVCADFEIRCCNTFAMIRELDFSTGWRSI